MQKCRTDQANMCNCFEELKQAHPEYSSFCNFYSYYHECYSTSNQQNNILLKSILTAWSDMDRYDYRNLYLMREISINYAQINEIDSSIFYLNKILQSKFDKNPYSAIYYRNAHVDLAKTDYRSGHFFKGIQRINQFINAKDSIFHSLDITQKAYTHLSLGSYYLNIPYEKFEVQGLSILDSLDNFLKSNTNIPNDYKQDIKSDILFERVRVLANKKQYSQALTMITNFYTEIEHDASLNDLGHISEEIAFLHLLNNNTEEANIWVDKSMLFYAQNNFIGEYVPYSYLMKAKVLSKIGNHDMAIDTLLKYAHKASGHKESIQDILSYHINNMRDPICLVEYLYELAYNHLQKFNQSNNNRALNKAISFIEYCHQLLNKLIINGAEWDTKYLIKDLQKDAYSLKKEIYYKKYGDGVISEIDKMRKVDLKLNTADSIASFTPESENTIINYTIIGDSLYAFISRNHKIEKSIALGNYDTIKTHIVNFLKSIYIKNDFKKHQKILSSILVSPLEIEDDIITLITEGDLSLLPFELLFNKNILEFDQTINYQLPSGSYFISNSNNRSNNIGLFNYKEYANNDCLEKKTLFSNLNPLNYADQENIQIATILSKEQKPLTLEEFKFSLINNKATHFSGHTYISDHHYALNYLLLDCESNQVFTMEDIRGTKINNEMVVLSACNTGIGTLIESDGILSLGRELIIAGAKSVISTLWSINDHSTSIIMTEFYKELLKGKRKDEALRQAKLTYLDQADPEYQHPYYWAGFIAMGDMSPLFFPQRKWYIAGFTLLGLCLIIAVYKTKFTPNRLAA